MSGPDSFQPAQAAWEERPIQPEDDHSEGNLTALAARFTDPSGGGLSPELSIELALEIVLNEIVEQACRSTGATGAAIVLRRDEEMVCRASSGSTAPPLGTRLSTSSGLVRECVRTMKMQRCDDVRSDPRADVEASLRLGIRSALLLPLTLSGALVGFFELFSSRPQAFAEADEIRMQVLADRAMRNLKRAAQPLDILRPANSDRTENRQASMSLASQPRSSESPEEVQPSPKRFDLLTSILTVGVIGSALLLGVVLGRDSLLRRSVRHLKPEPQNVAKADVPAPSNSQPGVTQPAAKPVQRPVPVGGMVVFEDGKEVFRLPSASSPASSPASAGQSNSLHAAITREQESVSESTSSQNSDGPLLTRVQPIYPEEALRQKVQDTVVLNVEIGVDGGVERVDVVSGAPLLASASTDAVKQWKFKPHMVKGVATPMETRVTFNFRLPPGS